MTVIEHSASSLELYLGCARRWVFERIWGHREEDTEQKGFGKDRHAELQAWIDSSKKPEHILALRMLALYAEHPYPPVRAYAKAEEHFRMEIMGVYWHGYTDWRRPGRRPLHRIVGDWKTTKDLKYALIPDKKTGLLMEKDQTTGELKVKAQPVIYATREYVEGAEDVTLSWAYGQSKDPWATRLVEVDVVRSACEDAYGGFHAKALEMNRLYQIRPKANDVPYNRGYCNAFNKPCEQSDRCNRARGMFSSDHLEGAPMSDFLSSMKQSFPGAAQTIEEEDAPPPPPEDDEAPPPPADSVPPPPPEEDEVEAERLAQEYMASQRKPGPAPTTVEAGFVNAPEAAGKVPYATPEEAAAGEGVTVVEIPAESIGRPDLAGQTFPVEKSETGNYSVSLPEEKPKAKRGRPKKEKPADKTLDSVYDPNGPDLTKQDEPFVDTVAEPVVEKPTEYPVRDEFAVHLLNSEGIEKAKALGAVFSRALDSLEHLAGKDGREMAIVRTKLQEASFMAKRAIAVRPENQK